jgi:hypothetical protein
MPPSPMYRYIGWHFLLSPHILTRMPNAFSEATLKLLAFTPSSCSLAENTCRPESGGDARAFVAPSATVVADPPPVTP